MKTLCSLILITITLIGCQTRDRRRGGTEEVSREHCGPRMGSNFMGPNGERVTRVQDRHDYCRTLVDTHGEPPLIGW